LDGACGPLQSIRPLVGACAPGHYGNPRAAVLIRSKTSRAMCGVRFQLRRGRPLFPSFSLSLANIGREAPDLLLARSHSHHAAFGVAAASYPRVIPSGAQAVACVPTNSLLRLYCSAGIPSAQSSARAARVSIGNKGQAAMPISPGDSLEPSALREASVRRILFDVGSVALFRSVLCVAFFGRSIPCLVSVRLRTFCTSIRGRDRRHMTWHV
jgi:hypothetical protein